LGGAPLEAVAGGAVGRVDAPVGVVGRCGDDADLVAAGGEPGAHLGGVFADAGELGGVVEAVDKDSQAILPGGRGEDGWNAWG
jgi:hypothetical protein